MKKRLMNDVLIDLTVCKLEGWDAREYISELTETLHDIMENFTKE